MSNALVDETSLVGSPERIKDRLQAWKEAGKRDEVGSMLPGGVTGESLRVVADAVLLGESVSVQPVLDFCDLSGTPTLRRPSTNRSRQASSKTR